MVTRSNIECVHLNVFLPDFDRFSSGEFPYTTNPRIDVEQHCCTSIVSHCADKGNDIEQLAEMASRLPFFPGRGNSTTTVVATPGYGPDRQVEVSYTDMKVIGNGSFGVVYSAKLCDTSEMIAIKKVHVLIVDPITFLFMQVMQDKRFKNRELQIMRKLEHQNVVKLKYFFYSGGDKVCFEMFCRGEMKSIAERRAIPQSRKEGHAVQVNAAWILRRRVAFCKDDWYFDSPLQRLFKKSVCKRSDFRIY